MSDLFDWMKNSDEHQIN